ncbi:AAA family ATPase [Pseudochelatococcus sp. B33]
MPTSPAPAPPTPTPDDTSSLEHLLAALQNARREMNEVVLGQPGLVTRLLIGLIAGGHILIEGPPGVGKTLTVKTLADVAGLAFARVQFTPDLMPADITGSMVLAPDAEGRNTLTFQPGPVFTQLLLADEINRATPRTQSALLEAMQEKTVSAAGTTMALPRPFVVLATQNPIEMDGTYPLPEAQIDRFLFRLDVSYPDAETLVAILGATTGVRVREAKRFLSPDDILALQALVRSVPVAAHVARAVALFTVSTQPGSSGAGADVNRFVRFGLSPRGAQALMLAAKGHALLSGRHHVAFEDLRAVLLPATRHRIQLNFQGRAEDINIERLVLDLFDHTVRTVA